MKTAYLLIALVMTLGLGACSSTSCQKDHDRETASMHDEDAKPFKPTYGEQRKLL